jgi:hypothetical protein
MVKQVKERTHLSLATLESQRRRHGVTLKFD